MRWRVSLSIVGVLVAASLASDLPAQGFFTQLTNPRGNQPVISESINYEIMLPTSASNMDDEVRSQRIAIHATVPLFIGEKSGVFFSPTFSHLALENRRNTLPPRLISTGGTLFGYTISEHSRRIYFGGMLQYDFRSDMMHWQPGDGQYLGSAFAFLPTGGDFYFALGLGYASDFAESALEGIPIPALELVYAPNNDLIAVVGIPFEAIQYRYADWLQFSYFGLMWYLSNISLTHKISEEVTLIEFFADSGDVFDITDQGYPRESRIFYRGLRAGETVKVKVPWNLTATFTYEFLFQSRWFIVSPYADSFVERIETKPGHALSISLIYRF